MRKNRFMLLAILLLGVGYSAVTTTLYIDGNVKIATNDADFNVRFAKATSDEGATISEDGKTITFVTSSLSAVGNKSTLNFEVENNSELYDAEVCVECSSTGANSSYYKITPSVVSPIEGKATEKGKVEIELITAKVDDTQDTFICTLTTTPKERDTKAEKPRYTPKYFAFDTPTTSSTQDYTTLTYPSGSEVGQQAKIFLGLDADGTQKSTCMLRNGILDCFKNGGDNVAEEQAHLREVFTGEGTSCTVNESNGLRCSDSDFYCDVTSLGFVNCNDNSAKFHCSVNVAGYVFCG